MGWSFRIARVAGIDVKIHVTFFLLLAWVAAVHYITGGPAAAVGGAIFILAVFFCVLLHEFGHAFAARLYGIRTPDITLLPIGGVARLQRMPERPIQEIVVALAGPAVNVVIALFLFALLGGWRSPGEIVDFATPGRDMLAKLAVVNIWLVLFNMLPAFPMDGGRVLRALLATAMPYTFATQIAARIGQGMAFLLGFVGLLINPLLLLVALFVYLAAAQEASYSQIRDIASGLQVRDAMVTDFRSLRPDSPLAEAVDLLLRTGQHEFPVMDDDGRILGILIRDDIVSGVRNHGESVPVATPMHRSVPSISVGAPLEEALARMQECRCPALGAVDAEGRLVGLVTPENVGELVMIHSVLPRGAKPSWREPL